MATDYYAVDSDDADVASQIIEGDHEASIGVEKEILARKLLAAVPDFTRVAAGEDVEADHIEREWDEDSYVQVSIHDAYVSVHHGGGGDLQLEVLESVLSLLGSEGLYIYDPQNGSILDEY